MDSRGVRWESKLKNQAASHVGRVKQGQEGKGIEMCIFDFITSNMHNFCHA